MKAAVFQGVNQGLAIEHVADPTPAPSQVVLKVVRSGVCGSDIKLTEPRGEPSPLDPFYDRLFAPGRILGHEFAGEVVALGRDVRNLKVGDRIAPMAATGCGFCLTCVSGKADWCTELHAPMGGYAEYGLANEKFCVRLPEGASYDDGMLIEPMGTCLHAVDLAHLQLGSRIIVFGAGAIGLGIVYFARRSGVRQIITVARSDRQKDLALRMGSDVFLTQGPDLMAQLADLTGGGADVAFEASGALGVIDQAMLAVRPQGLIVSAGINLLPDPVRHALAVGKEIRLQYSASYTRSDFEYLANLFGSETVPLSELVTRRVGLSDFPAAFEDLRTRNAECKLMLDPWG